MKKSLILLILLSYCFKSFSQNIVVVDSLTKEPISFSVIKFNKNGFYTSQSGEFDLNQIKNDSFEINSLGFKKRVLKTTIVKDTIFLSNEINLLEEVLLHKKIVYKELKLSKKPKIFSSWVLQPRTEILTAIYPSNEVENFYIDKINIGFAKVKEKKKLKDSNIKAYIRLHFYENDNKKPSNQLYCSKPLDVNSFKKDEISIDISNNLIKLNPNGIYIGLGLIGYYNKTKEIELNPIIRPLFTNKSNDFFSSQTFIRYVFKNETNIVAVNDLLKKGMSERKEFKRNLNIGMTLSK